MNNKRLLGSLQVLLASVTWSFSGVFCKWIPWDSLPMSGIRMFLTALIFCAIRGTWRVPLTRGNILGAIGVSVTSLLFLVAVKLTSAANAIVLQYAMPLFVILFTSISTRKLPARREVITCFVILFGVLLCSWEGLGGGHLLGDAIALFTALTFTLVFCCSKMPDANTMEYTHLGFYFGAPFMLCAIGNRSMTAEPVHWLAIFVMALCLTGGYFFISKGIKNTSPVTAALLGCLEPILNPVWVFLFLGEKPGVFSIVGAIIVLTAATVYSIIGVREG